MFALVAVVAGFGRRVDHRPAAARRPTTCRTRQPAAAKGRRGGARGPQPIAYEDCTGFELIFDGKTLENWDGDPAVKRVADGAIVGETSEANALKENTFNIYARRAGRLRTEGGVPHQQHQQRHPVPQRPPAAGHRGRQQHHRGKWALKGYQADIDIANQFTGMLYEERAEFAAHHRLRQRRPARLPARFRDQRRAGSRNKDKDWNQFHVIARGGTLIHILNGHVTALFVDDDAEEPHLKARLLGFQIHVGPPMKVEFRNIYLKAVKQLSFSAVGFPRVGRAARARRARAANLQSAIPLSAINLQSPITKFDARRRRSAARPAHARTYTVLPADRLEVEEQGQVDRGHHQRDEANALSVSRSPMMLASAMVCCSGGLVGAVWASDSFACRRGRAPP